MSINQNANTGALPNFRNLGILLRILIIVDGICLAAALVKTSEPLALLEELIDVSSTVQPALILSLLALAAASNVLHRMRYGTALACVILLELGLTASTNILGAYLFGTHGTLARDLIFAVLITGVLIGYFDLRGRALSPALTEARLQALQARIRPHFLFNTLNTAIALVRVDPGRAETLLEDLAELFRAALADAQAQVTLEQEVELARRYLDIEQVRFGGRLQVQWELDPSAGPARLPPLILQPLVENAVYHGIEPGSQPGTINISARRVGDQVRLELINPYWPEHQHRQGNRMALVNITERLALHFDVEASLETKHS